MMQPAGYLAFSLHGENGSHHTVANRGNYLRRPRPLLPPSCGRGVGSPKAGPPAWAQAPAPLAFPRTLFSSCLLPTTVDFPPLQNYGSGDRNDPPGLAPPFIHCPTFFFFLVPPHNPTSWKVSTPAVFTSLPVVRSAAHSDLASIPPAQLKWLLSPH